jgi:ABC-type Fe3+/spermidine/putrescine transport system ATPase subunit
MEKGRIVQSGSPAELYDHPLTPYVADFIGNSNKLYGRIVSADAEQISLLVGGVTIRSTPGQTRYFPGDEVLATIRPEKVRLLRADEDAGNRCVIPGTVREILFHGSSCRLEIDIGQRQLFDVDVQLELALDTSQLQNPGSSVRLAFNPEMVSVFPISEDNV